MEYLKRSYGVLLGLIALVAACGSEGEPTATPSHLIGTWTLTELSGNSQATATENGLEYTANNDFTGSAFNYDLTLTEKEFMTNGSYLLNNQVSVDGLVLSMSVDTITGTNGSGTYTINGNEITTMGAFIDNELNGGEAFLDSDSQTSQFEIDDQGLLIITLDQTTEEMIDGILTMVTVDLSTTWVKKQ